MPQTSQDPFQEELPSIIPTDTQPTPSPAPAPVYAIPEPTQEEVDASLADLARSMSNFDRTVYTTGEVRQQLLQKLLPTAMEMDMTVSRSTDPDLYAAQTRLYGEVRQLLNDMDASARQHTATKLKQKDQENDTLNAINAAELLNHIKLSGGVPVSNVPQPSQEEIDKAIAEQFKERGCLVLESELVENDRQIPEKKVSDEL